MTHYSIVGAGQVGRRLATLLIDSGATVELISRSGASVAGARGVSADASDAQALLSATAEADVIYNCVNPAYHRWQTDWPPIAGNLLAAARGKTLVTLSNLYGYGPVDAPMTESTPLAATTRKGAVRAQMWRDALAAHDAGDLRAVEVRGSDYIGEAGDQVTFGARVIPRMAAGKSVQLLGRTDEPHTWTYTGDVAALLAAVAPRTQAQVLADLAKEMGVDVPRVRTIGAVQLRMAGLFSPTIRELSEMLYEFDRPFVMDSSAAEQTFGLAPTPWEVVVEQTVARNLEHEAV
jgi:nucleoside-diphosphate-sugar epimerase